MSNQDSIAVMLSSFSEYDDRTAIIWQNTAVTYRQILRRIDFWREKISFEEGRIVAIEGDFSPESIALLFVLIEQKAVVVPLDINHRDKNQKKYKIAQVDTLIRITAAEEVTIEELDPESRRNELYGDLAKFSAPGLVLFTSGSSGEPKAALHNFSKLLAKFEVRRKALTTINFLLFDHWGGLNTLFHILSNGGTVVILENRSPDYVCELIEKYSVELLPTSPTFLNMLIMSRAYERNSLKSLKMISYGAEPMPEHLLRHLNDLFPDITFQQTYGLIELGVMRSKSEGNGSLWVKIGGEGYQTRVVDGILQIKSDSAMLGYLNAISPFTEDGWFVTGDSVEVNGDYFRILGRKSEIINVGGEKVFPQEVENVVLEIPGITDVLVYGEDNRLTGKIVCAKVRYEGDEEQKEIIRQIKIRCREKLQSFKIPVRIVFSEDGFTSDRFKKTRVNAGSK